MTTALEKAKKNILGQNLITGIVPGFTISDSQTIAKLLSISDLTEEQNSENIIKNILMGYLF